jgi:actin-related protein 6
MSHSNNTLVIDNGAGNIKIGFINQNEPSVIPNATAKVSKSMQYLVGSAINQCQNGALLQFNRPFERGYLTNMQCEIEVWMSLLSGAYKCNPGETRLVVTEPVLNPYSLQCDMNEVVFEYFGFKEHLRRPTPWFIANYCMKHANPPIDIENLPSCVVVDSGFSFTHIVQFFNGKCQRNAVGSCFVFSFLQ